MATRRMPITFNTALRAFAAQLYDGDLTGRPISNTSRTYPGAAYGYMGDTVQLGYQAALVSMHSPTYGRLWLSVKPHPGDKVACKRLQEMVRMAEEASGVRPRRRTELVDQQIDQLEQECRQRRAKWAASEQKMTTAQLKREEVASQMQYWQHEVERLQADYEAKGRPERPHSLLGQARRKLSMYQQRLPRRDKEIVQYQHRSGRHQEKYQACLAQLHQLYQHLQKLKADNATNHSPVRIKFRLDAGFGTKKNVAWLIEMGYEVYTKPFSHRVASSLQKETPDEVHWARVGHNAEMTAWANRRVGKYRYPLNTALVRYHLGHTLAHTTLLHYGHDQVTDDLTTWFQTYNGRQTIEAGIKEGKGVFQMHHLKVRSAPALFLQEHFALFAANFVRWAAHWLAQQPPAVEHPSILYTEKRTKHLVLIAAHTSAWVFWQQNGCLLRFTDQSLYSGQSLLIGNPYSFQLPLPLFKTLTFY